MRRRTLLPLAILALSCPLLLAQDAEQSAASRAHWNGTIDRLAVRDGTMSDRRIQLERVVDASPSELWTLWTTSEGIASWLTGEKDGEPNAHVELRIGGPFECYFGADFPEGQRGSEGSVILSYIPERMLSFTWNAPPIYPEEREERTWVVVEFEPVTETQTLVRLTHVGWPGDGWNGEGDWPGVFEYFEKAWPNVLRALDAHVAESG